VVVIALSACTSESATPDSTRTITIHEFFFDVSGTPPTTGTGGPAVSFSASAGQAVHRVVNEGQQPHEVRVMRMRGKAGADEAVQFLLGAGPRIPPGDFVGDAVVVPAGGAGTFELDLEPGDYALVCTLEDPATGQPYAARGLARDLFVAR
jgi:hypothetical protein